MESLSYEKAEKLRVKAQDALDQQRYSDAVIHLNAAIWLRQEDPELLEMRGEAFAALCDVQSALLNYRRALKLSGQEDADEVARRSTVLARMLDLRAITMLDEGSFAQALSLLAAITRVSGAAAAAAAAATVTEGRPRVHLREEESGIEEDSKQAREHALGGTR